MQISVYKSHYNTIFGYPENPDNPIGEVFSNTEQSLEGGQNVDVAFRHVQKVSGRDYVKVAFTLLSPVTLARSEKNN